MAKRSARRPPTLLLQTEALDDDEDENRANFFKVYGRLTNANAAANATRPGARLAMVMSVC